RAASEGVGKGATFTIALPLGPHVPIQAAEQASGHSPRGACQRVLVIEDNIDAANALCMVLQLEGYEVDVAYNGPNGLQHARTFAPDIVVCDIGLPEMSGYEVARTLRAHPELGHAALVALTGYAGPEDVKKTKEAGFDAHLAKPVNATDLLRVMTRLLVSPQT